MLGRRGATVLLRGAMLVWGRMVPGLLPLMMGAGQVRGEPEAGGGSLRIPEVVKTHPIDIKKVHRC